MAKQKVGTLSADMIRRTVARKTQIIGPDGSIETVWAIIPGNIAA